MSAEACQCGHLWMHHNEHGDCTDSTCECDGDPLSAPQQAELDQHMAWLAQTNPEVHAYRARMSATDQYEHMQLDRAYEAES